MDTSLASLPLRSIAQRAVYSYLLFLTEEAAVLLEGADASHRELHAFFRSLYLDMFERPEQFGLPTSPDDALGEDEPDPVARKQEVTRRLKPARERIEKGLAFLMAAAQRGQPEGTALRLGPEEAAAWKKSRALREFFLGFEPHGLTVVPGDPPALTCSRAVNLLPALQSLAVACAQHPNPGMGRFHFARCDFRALRPGFHPDPLELYRAFPPEDFARLEELHAFYTARGYQSQLDIHDVYAWLVQYQGSRKIKSSPLFQIEYQDRYRNPRRMGIKCASTARLLPLLGGRSQALREDFKLRTLRCRGDECGWCRNQKTLGPTPIIEKGETYDICWYSIPDVRVLDDASVELMKEYLLMHEELLPG